MTSKILSVGLLLTFAGMCLCQQQAAASSPTPYQAAVSQASFQKASSAAQQPQIKLEDIERDSLAAAYGQKSQQQASKPLAATSGSLQQQQQQSYQVPQQQYFLQPYQSQPQQFYVQPLQDQQQQHQQQQYLTQPYQMAFDYSGVQYMIINPNAYNPVGNQVYQQYFVPAAQPSPVPQYVTKQSSPAAAQAPQQYKQLAAPAQVQQVYRQQFVVPTLVPQEYKPQFAVPAQQQYVMSEPVYQYVQQPAAPTTTATAGPGPSPADFSYVTHHPAAPSAQFKAPAAAPVQASAAVQPQFQYTAVPQQYQQQPQYYYTTGQVSAAAAAAAEQPQRVQQSLKSQYSSGVKSTTPFPVKESFAYKFESSPQQPQQQQQQPSAAYSTLKYSA